MDRLRCPKTGNNLQLAEAASLLRVEHSELTYPLVGGIIDFCPESKDRIAASYDRVAPRYDSHMLSSTIATKIVGRVVWGGLSDRDPMEEVLSLLPDSFDGVLLDVPVGTGVFTASLYGRYPDATIIAVDCSLNMLRRAQARFREHGVRNVHFLKADAANLPIRDEAVDMVLSMNGWHAFADKRGAVEEMRRVLPINGKLIACGYVTGVRRRADWFVRHFGVRHGYFTPPFFTEHELAEQFRGFTINQGGCDRSVAWFEAAVAGHESPESARHVL
jgi:SAM-dependent methyltransferase